MKLIDKTLNQQEISLLKSLKEEKIKLFKGYELFEDPSTWHETLVFKTNKQIFTIENQFEDVPFSNDEGAEDFGVMSISDKEEDIWLPAGIDAKTVSINKYVKDVFEVNCKVEYKNVQQDTNIFKFTQALVFCFEDNALVINRDIWFNDFLFVKIAEDYRQEIRDVHDDWMCEEDEYVDVEQTFKKLT